MFLNSGAQEAREYAEHKNTQYGRIQQTTQAFCQACVAWFKATHIHEINEKREFSVTKNEHAGAGRGRDRRLGVISPDMEAKLAAAGVVVE